MTQVLVCLDGGMVDTRDLKSLGQFGCVGSSPTLGTEEKTNILTANSKRLSDREPFVLVDNRFLMSES